MTSKFTVGDVDGLKVAGLVGVNVAVSWWGPMVNVEVDPDAAPLVTITGLPRLVVPSLNCTVPTAAAGLTAAVSVTRVPARAPDAGEVASAVLVAVAPVAAVMMKSTGGDVEGLKATGLVGMNVAVRERWPAARVEVDPDAEPLVTITGLPRLVVASLNCTVPVAVAGVIVAVSVTGVPGAAWPGGEMASAVLVATAPGTTNITTGDVDGL